MGEYKVSITNGTVGQAEKGECSSISSAIKYGYKAYDSENDDETDIMFGTSGYTVTGKHAYLKYASTDEVVAEETVPEACIYSDTYGGELCLKNNEFETSLQNILDYFGYDASTWTNTSGDTWENSTQTITCDFETGYDIETDTDVIDRVHCYDSIVELFAHEGDVYVGESSSSCGCIVTGSGVGACTY